MNLFRALPYVALVALTALSLTACGATQPMMLQRQAVTRPTLQAQTTTAPGQVQAQYFSVLMNITYTPDGGTHFGFDRVSAEYTDSRAKHVRLGMAWSVQGNGNHFMLNLTRSGLGGQPVTERISMDNLAGRAEVARQLSMLQGSEEDNALLARLIKIITPAAR